jgi:mannitol/fructose-specific phosphotransferase system IIA component (Ntr-type)
MNLLDYTHESGFLVGDGATDLAAAVRGLVETLATAGDVTDPAGLVDEVLRRENAGSTAIGGGVVIPHARFEGIGRLRIAVATLASPLDIPSEDGLPVDIVILLVGPADDPRQMLRVLARLARQVRDQGFLDGLRAAEDPEALCTALSAGS